MRLLLHICCAPCSVACVNMLREEGTEPAGFWYNPNIHPFLEIRPGGTPCGSTPKISALRCGRRTSTVCGPLPPP